MTRAASKPAGWEAVVRALPPSGPRALARRLADGPGVLWRGQRRIGPVCVGIAFGWKPALEREAREQTR